MPKAAASLSLGQLALRRDSPRAGEHFGSGAVRKLDAAVRMEKQRGFRQDREQRGKRFAGHRFSSCSIPCRLPFALRSWA